VDRNTLLTSNSVTITGINISMPVRITRGEYSIDGGPFTDGENSISANQTIRLRLRSSDEYDTVINARLSIGGVHDTFTVTTREKSGGGGGGGGTAAWLLPLCLVWLLRKRISMLIAR
jgi:hypothetical protein